MTRRRWILAIVALVLVLGAGVAVAGYVVWQNRHPGDDPRLEHRRVRDHGGARRDDAAGGSRPQGPVADVRLRRATHALCAALRRAPALHDHLGEGNRQPARVPARRRIWPGLRRDERRPLPGRRRGDGKDHLAEDLRPLHRRLADYGRGRHLPAAHGPVPVPGAQAGRGRLCRGDRPRYGARALALRGRRRRDLAARRREPPLLRVVGQEDVRGRRRIPTRRCGRSRPATR